MERIPKLSAGRGLGASDDGRWALAGLALSMLMPSLDTSIANVGLPALAMAFGISFPSVQWIVLAYLLTVTALIVAAGRLGDLIGRRRLLLGGIVLFSLASLLCGGAPSFAVLVAARAAQGVGAAVMMALAVALAGEVVPKEKTGSAMGMLGAMSAIGTTLGPSLGGLLIAGLGWRSIFWVNVPLGMMNFALARYCLPSDHRERGSASAGFDGLGTTVLALALAAYALAMTLGTSDFGPLNLLLLLAAILGGWGFLHIERRVPFPLLRPAMLLAPGLGACLAMSALVSTVMMATLVVGPFYLSRALGLGAAQVGFVMSVGPLVAALTGVPAGRLVDRVGTGRMTRVGLIGMGIGLAALAVVPGWFGVVGYLAALSVVTAHYAVFQAANNTATMRFGPRDQRGVTAGMLNLARNLGLVTGASFMGAVFARAMGGKALALTHPAAVAGGMRITFALAALLMGVALLVAVRVRGSPPHARLPVVDNAN
jgi:MFS family permease